MDFSKNQFEFDQRTRCNDNPKCADRKPNPKFCGIKSRRDRKKNFVFKWNLKVNYSRKKLLFCLFGWLFFFSGEKAFDVDDLSRQVIIQLKEEKEDKCNFNSQFFIELTNAYDFINKIK